MVCEDIHANCGVAWQAVHCPGYQFVVDGCPKMCGKCGKLHFSLTSDVKFIVYQVTGLIFIIYT